jgi:flagellar biosynthesis/type III secretory pathway protein FliH
VSSVPQRYAFPSAAQFDAARREKPDKANNEAQDKALRDAIQQGYGDGFEEGRIAAEGAAKVVLEDARRQGFAAGRDQGLAAVSEAAAILRQALEQFNDWRAELLNQAEAFCVELALAVAQRLLELDDSGAEFVTRTVQSAIGLLAPEPTQAIFVNPANLVLVAAAFPQLQVCAEDSVPPGGVRIETGRLLIESDLRQAFEKIKCSLLETRDYRIRVEGNKQEPTDESK